MNTVMSHIDNMMQYGEDEEPRVSSFVDQADHLTWSRYRKIWTRASLSLSWRWKRADLFTGDFADE